MMLVLGEKIMSRELELLERLMEDIEHVQFLKEHEKYDDWVRLLEEMKKKEEDDIIGCYTQIKDENSDLIAQLKNNVAGTLEKRGEKIKHNDVEITGKIDDIIMFGKRTGIFLLYDNDELLFLDCELTELMTNLEVGKHYRFLCDMDVNPNIVGSEKYFLKEVINMDKTSGQHNFSSNYEDSPSWIWDELFSDAEISGVIVSKIEEEAWLWKLTIQDRYDKLYTICYNPEKYGDRFQIGDAYHFVGTVAGGDGGTNGALRIDRAINLNKPQKSKDELFSVLERMLKILKKRKDYETYELPRYKKLPITHRTIQDDNILYDFISSFQNVWSGVEATMKCIGEELDVDVCIYATSVDAAIEVEDYLNHISKILSDAFNKQSSSNYAQFEFEKEFGGRSNGGVTYGIITNSLAYSLAFAVWCGISDTMREIERENVAHSSFEERQVFLIKGLNRTWNSIFDSKVVPMIIDANDKIETRVKEQIYKTFGCNEQEYKEWLDKRVLKTEPTEKEIKILNDLIKKNEAVIANNKGILPFGAKAKARDFATREIQHLSDEIDNVLQPKEIDGLEIWISDLTFNSFESYRQKAGYNNPLTLIFNDKYQVYEIRSNNNNNLLGYTNRVFTVRYNRFRNLFGQILQTERLSNSDGTLSNKMRMQIRIIEK